MTTPNEELRARLADLLAHVDRETCTHEETHRGGAIWTICDSCGKSWADDRGGFVPHEDAPPVAAARAALARQEEGREAVYQCRPKAFAPWTDCDLETYNRLPRDQYDVRILYRHPAPPSAGAGDAMPHNVALQSLVEAARCYGVAQAKGDAAAIDHWNDQTNALLRRLATPTPQAADITAIAELREIMADESGEREASLVSFFRTTGAAMGRHGDAMGWTPEQTARHYLSEASK